MNIFKRGMLFVTFFGCCFAIALMAAALGTKYWFEAEARQRSVIINDREEYRPNSTGHIHFGLFYGKKSLNVGFGERLHPVVVPDDFPLMQEGLWQATVACLCFGLVFAVIGALFAIINTATTPVEAITGVPGLYIWNGIAALMDLICVICWAVQFSVNLSDNVLVVNSADGWTTKDQQHLGYSFWLVVVAILIHLANCVIIGIGTHEPKVKESVENPDSKGGNIMLY